MVLFLSSEHDRRSFHEPDPFHYWAVASLGWVSPGAAAEGVTRIFF